MHTLIGKALKYLYMLKESLILCKHIFLSLTVKKNTILIVVYALFKKYLPIRELTLTNFEKWNSVIFHLQNKMSTTVHEEP